VRKKNKFKMRRGLKWRRAIIKKEDVSLERGAKIAKLPLLDFIGLIDEEKIFRKVDVDNIRRLILEEFNTEI
jgi:predicted HTH domain antitoxin